MAKILKLNAISPLADGIFQNYEYSDSVKDPDGIIVRSAAMADYATGQSLCAVARAGAGTNNIPVADYTEKGIVVFNTPGANANAVKELVICELFLGGRKICDAIDWVKTLKGEGEGVTKLVEKGKGKFAGAEIAGKTLGVIGLGAIGGLVANAACALGMKVIGSDPFLSVQNALSLNPSVKVSTNDEIFEKADFITLHIPLTPDTKGMFDEAKIARLKDGVVLINNSRGELVNSQAMISALQSGKVARYITDFPTADLIGVSNAVCLPHLGASTPEAEDNCAVMAANQLVDYLENGNIVNSVNYPANTQPRSGKARVCVLHRNIANMIASITALISRHGVNIENFSDRSRGNYAYCIIDISEPLPQETIEEIAKTNGVLKVRTL
jgi:D-3-phosphoglycerate dehydrogenase